MTYVNRPDQRGDKSKDGGRATVRWVFADATARTNFTPLHSSPQPSAYDIGSEAWQLSDDSFWSLKSINPNVWVTKGSGGGGGTGNVTWSGNQAIALETATGVGPTVVPVGGVVGATNQAVAAAGSNFTLDLPIAANTRVTVYAYGTIKDTTATKRRYIAGSKVIVARDAGAPTIDSTPSYQTDDDNASIYSADVNPVALYGAFSISGNNLRFTVTAHATNNQKVNIDLYPYVTPDPV